MGEVSQDSLFQGVSVDIMFREPRPSFGDLFLICGETHPRFPPSGMFTFDTLADLQFEQVDDYFGVRSSSEEGDDVPIWLYPLVDAKPVFRHPGPFDAVRIDYNILRNPARRAEHYLRCIQGFAALGTSAVYRNRDKDLGMPPNLSQLSEDIDTVVNHWLHQGITVGSSKALKIAF